MTEVIIGLVVLLASLSGFSWFMATRLIRTQEEWRESFMEEQKAWRKALSTHQNKLASKDFTAFSALQDAEFPTQPDPTAGRRTDEFEARLARMP